MLLEILVPIGSAIAGLYYLIFKNHGCIKRIEQKVDAMVDYNYLKEEITDLKDAVRQIA